MCRPLVAHSLKPKNPLTPERRYIKIRISPFASLTIDNWSYFLTYLSTSVKFKGLAVEPLNLLSFYPNSTVNINLMISAIFVSLLGNVGLPNDCLCMICTAIMNADHAANVLTTQPRPLHPKIWGSLPQAPAIDACDSFNCLSKHCLINQTLYNILWV